MTTPSRAKPLLRRLEQFIETPALARFLADRILHETEHAQIPMLKAMLQIGASGCTAPIRALCAATTSPEVAELALAILAADDTPEATSAAASRLVEVYADQGIGPEDAGVCDLCVGFELLMPLEWTDAADNALMLYQEPLPDHAENWRENFAFLLPQDDPAAGKRRCRQGLRARRTRARPAPRGPGITGAAVRTGSRWSSPDRENPRSSPARPWRGRRARRLRRSGRTSACALPAQKA